MSYFLRSKKGFALLYAILLTGAILTIGVVLMNIITKQLIFSSINRNSEVSYYYLANSGRECLRYYLENGNIYSYTAGSWNYSGDFNISCLKQTITLKRTDATLPSGKKVITYSTNGDLAFPAAGNFKINLSIQLNEACLEDSTTCSGVGSLNRAWAVVRAEGGNVAGAQITKRGAVTAFVY